MKSRVVLLCAWVASCSLLIMVLVHGSPACGNTCGGIAVSYPFGTKPGCGSKVFQRYVQCSKGELLLTTHTGQYEISYIDYANQILIVNDKWMSTCTAMRRTQGATTFGLEEGTPFRVQGTTVVMLACMGADSIVQTARGSVCDGNGAQVCQSLYGYCPSITNLGLSVNSAIGSCCVLRREMLMGHEGGAAAGSSYEVDVGRYGCRAYTSIYRFGAGLGYGNDDGFSSDYRNPAFWSFGISLAFSFQEAAYSPACRACEASHGACAFADDDSFLHCVCPSGFNVSAQCPQGAQLSEGIASVYMAQNILRRAIFEAFIHILVVKALYLGAS